MRDRTTITVIVVNLIVIISIIVAVSTPIGVKRLEGSMALLEHSLESFASRIAYPSANPLSSIPHRLRVLDQRYSRGSQATETVDARTKQIVMRATYSLLEAIKRVEEGRGGDRTAIGCRSYSNLHFVVVAGGRAMSDATRRCLESQGPHQKKGETFKLKA
ncbi:hypothetical protein L3X38_037948 [Prunus dulcis]|uniref:Uncharacterized protein n=1 Tax=Prunus dulcis TaxID=3755 RepID=A0AAD4V445_PRUDU|nr:hypothetical protein L3X38_037948 [Prunus dulcis]